MNRKTLLGLALALVATSASALVQPMRINFQGKLIDPTTNNPRTGPVTLKFCLYSDPTLGSCPGLYTETQAGIPLTNGVFSVQIGALTGLPRDLFLGASVYLGVTVTNPVDAAGEMTPRQNLVMSAYAFTANQLSDVNDVRLIAGQTYSTFTSAGNFFAPGGISGSSGSFTNGITASTGTFLGSAFSVGASSFTVGGGSATVAYQLSAQSVLTTSSVTASTFYGDGAHLTGIIGSLSGGVAGYVPSWTGGTTQGLSKFWETASSDTALGTSGFAVLGSNFAVGTSTFVVSGGSVAIGHAVDSQFMLDVSGDAEFEGSTTHVGQTTVESTMTVQGSAFSVGGSSFTVAGGSATVAYNLNVGSLGVQTVETVTGTMTITGNAFSVGTSTFVVSGGSVAIGHAVDPLFMLDVAGSVEFEGSVTHVGQTTVESTVTIQGSAFSVGGTSFTVGGGSATVTYGLTATNVTSSSLTLTSNGNALVLSGTAANITFTGAGVSSVTTAANNNLGLAPGGTGKLVFGTGGTAFTKVIFGTCSLAATACAAKSVTNFTACTATNITAASVLFIWPQASIGAGISVVPVSISAGASFTVGCMNPATSLVTSTLATMNWGALVP